MKPNCWKGCINLAKVPSIQYVHIGKPAETSRLGDCERLYIFMDVFFCKNIIEEEIYQTHPIHLDFIKEYCMSLGESGCL
jgi:hypothetical protein